jgi:hypothetical protein
MSGATLLLHSPCFHSAEETDIHVTYVRPLGCRWKRVKGLRHIPNTAEQNEVNFNPSGPDLYSGGAGFESRQ